MKDYSDTEIYKLYLKIHNECIDRIQKETKIGLLEQEIVYKIIAIVRESNKKWNEEAEKNGSLANDGFMKAMKKKLLELNISDSLNGALKYL